MLRTLLRKLRKKNSNDFDFSRRRFLKATLATGVAALAFSGAVAYAHHISFIPPEQIVDSHDVERLRKEVVYPYVIIFKEGDYTIAVDYNGRKLVEDVNCIKVIKQVLLRVSDGSTIVLGSGRYKISDLDITKSVRFLGVGDSTIIELTKSNYSVKANASKIIFENLKIESYVDGTHQIVVTDNVDTLEFRRVIFYAPIAYTDSYGFIESLATVNEPRIIFEKCRITQFGRKETGARWTFCRVYTTGGYKGVIQVDGMVVDYLAYGPSPPMHADLFYWSSDEKYTSYVRNVDVKYIDGDPDQGLYLVSGIHAVEDVVLRDMSEGTRFVDITPVNYARNVTYVNVTGRVGTPKSPIGIYTGIRFINKWGRVSLSVLTGKPVHCMIFDCYFGNGGGIECSGGAYRSVEISNCTFVNTDIAIFIDNETNAQREPLYLLVDNCYMLMTGVTDGVFLSVKPIGGITPNLKFVVLRNVHVHVTYEDGTGGAEFLDLSKYLDVSAMPDVTFILEDCSLIPTKTRAAGGGFCYFWRDAAYMTRPETWRFIMRNCVFYTESIDKFLAKIKGTNKYIGRYDRLENVKVYWNYDGSLIIEAPHIINKTVTPAIGTGDTYGDPTVIYSWSGIIRYFDAKISVSGVNTASSEIITVKIECIWESGNITYIEKNFTADGDYVLNMDDKLTLWRNGDTLVEIRVYAKSNLNDTTASVTVYIIGA